MDDDQIKSAVDAFAGAMLRANGKKRMSKEEQLEFEALTGLVINVLQNLNDIAYGVCYLADKYRP